MPVGGIFSSKGNRKLEAFLYSPSGDVGKELRRRAGRVRDAAKRQVGYKTGRLYRSIRVYDHNRLAIGQSIKIGTSVPYAKYHHNGTKPHMIYPKRKQVLKFRSGTLVGGNVFARSVHHRGTKPNRFLKDNIKYMYMP